MLKKQDPYLKHEVNHNKIIIDITYDCDLKCIDCNRSCRQAPSKECMSLGQIKRFIKESIEQKRNWKEITVEGGEPSLHPQVVEIFKLLVDYKKKRSSSTKIRTIFNGFGSQISKIQSKLPKEVLICNARKKSQLISKHCSFNVAPIDTQEYKNCDFSNGCNVPSDWGMGLTRYGYYAHTVCGGIDRIFGFNIGRKRLPEKYDSMRDQMKILCKYCGHFKRFDRKKGQEGTPGRISESWKIAYKKYKKEKPLLSLY